MHKILVDYALPFGYEALEPYLSREINHFHFDKHTVGYIKRYNDEIERHSDLNTRSFLDTMQTLVKEILNGDIRRIKLFQDGAQAWNHYAFWSGIGLSKPMNSGSSEMIINTFGAIENFKEDFINAGKSRFGSGWLWLIKLNGELDLVTTHDADAPIFHLEPLVTVKSKKQVNCLIDTIEVLSVCDLWEHSYYLQYKNDRETYLRNFVNYLMDWDFLDQAKIITL